MLIVIKRNISMYLLFLYIVCVIKWLIHIIWRGMLDFIFNELYILSGGLHACNSALDRLTYLSLEVRQLFIGILAGSLEHS